MPAIELRPAFRQRVRALTRQMWALHVGRGVARTAVVAVALVTALAAVDYFVELPVLARAALFVPGAVVVAVLAARWVVRPALTWGRARVAVVLEALFPRLGQRLRTALEHGPRSADELARAGVAPGLVAALEEETAEKVKPLPFQAALPVRPMVLAGVAGAVCIAALVFSASQAPEWRTALGRVMLSPDPYTALSVSTSADTVDEGADVNVHATLTGRTRPAVVLHVRPLGESEWRDETMDEADGGFSARLPKLRSSVEFFVSAGPDSTPVQQITVRRYLKITGTRVEVRSPDYTGVAPVTHEIGSFSAVQGSTARFQFELDRPPAAAALVVKEPGKSAASRRIDMTVRDREVSVELPLAADIEYSVDARDAAGVPVVANRARVRVTADQPPAVWFEEPTESMEVHTLAEVLMRARARDDFGVSKVGIVFQVNNEEERTLVVQDVKEPFQRTAAAGQMLLLEQFLLTEKDCVAYYAFAEDNHPGTPQRVTTELRFIDIRPFKRTYKVFDAPDAPPGPQRELIFLDEVIARQRFNLNQTIRLETRSKARLDVAQVDKVAAFENKLATQTHDLADFLAGLGADGTALLTQAEETMLSAVDSLQGAKFTTALAQERDALRYLMEARNTVQQSLPKLSKAARAQARAFDRIQRQKLRRQDEKAETLAAIANELGQLASQEDDVFQMLAVAGNAGGAGGKASDPMKTPPAADKPGTPDQAKPAPAADKPDPNKPGAGKPDPEKPDPNKPGSGQPDPEKPDPNKPGAGKPDPEKPDPNKPAPGTPDPTKPAGDKPAPGAPDPAKPAEGDKPGPGSMPPVKPDEASDPIRERQDEIAARASVLDKTAASAKGLTELAKKRIADAAKAANGAADALGQQNRADAKKDAEGARDLFRLAAKQVAALAAEEAAQQLAAARDLANDIALQTAPPTDPQAGGMGGSSDDKKMGLGGAAEQAKTLKDVLEQIAGAGSESSAEAARRAGTLLKQEDLGAAIGRLEKPGAGADKTERQDLAERFAALGQKLDQAHRELIAPRLEELAKLEREAAELAQRLGAAGDDTASERVRPLIAEFVEKLDKARLGELVGPELREGIRGASGVAAAAGYARKLAVVREKLVAKLQEFVAGDRYTTGGEAVPPEYRELVDRYLRALSAGSTK
ncbi:DUF4175 family protein [Fimbriiglobus ruber]|uniref:Proline-rich protein n=1 Tax=Fimbriiglobus ruber TaxID=1908690 RepID=A0A225DX25_9BACT|nr:DUF4175 family protein [Fimbriiglobus ruber]OWK43038.1 Proline-rich protein [Fimbriiglobus ruber]